MLSSGKGVSFPLLRKDSCAPAANQRAALQAVQLDAGRARAQDLGNGRIQAQLGAAQLPARAAVRAAPALLTTQLQGLFQGFSMSLSPYALRPRWPCQENRSRVSFRVPFT